MPFFREFTKKVTQGSQEAVQKTRDMASILSWNADITDAEARIYDLEEDLGRAVFAENFEGMTKEQIQDILAMDESESLTLTISDWRPFTETLLKILEDKDLIADREKRIASLKGELRCPSCYKILTKGARFCPNCGARVQMPDPEKEEAEKEDGGEE